MKSIVSATTLVLGLSGIFLSPAASDAGQVQAIARMKSPEGTEMGTVILTQMSDALLLRVEISGLTPGAHGFHIHETGACDPDFEAAGGHFDADGQGHGYTGQGAHSGDLPNLVAHGDGSAAAEFLTREVSLERNAHGALFDKDGSAIVIHANADSYGNSAGAGSRVACGVVKLRS
ncbi:superoxide dismutase family protein [Pelagibius sp. Alg239-R121]|uniref:superoxide dismutase family protein n=1 Tax=Pelagibius sp. Alg239-R121 TaxID=2993448 RepID=UPI0024A73CFA|nr:superoxide dismutase family protein [Pelagibius sp. Alg239-R121]